MINLKNRLWSIFSFIIIIVVGIGIYLLNNKTKTDYISNKISTNSTNYIYEKNNTSNSIQEKNLNDISQKQENSRVTKEEIISSFSTKIYTKDSARQNNITITCNTLNNTIIENGSTFSFCNTIGKSTYEKGYKEADIYDKYGNKEKGLGGGNCQVSTTLYNAALKVPAILIIERHEHSNTVPYIESGKDAAVAYGSFDLKLQNNTGFNLKIKAENNDNSVNVYLYKLF